MIVVEECETTAEVLVYYGGSEAAAARQGRLGFLHGSSREEEVLDEPWLANRLDTWRRTWSTTTALTIATGLSDVKMESGSGR